MRALVDLGEMSAAWAAAPACTQTTTCKSSSTLLPASSTTMDPDAPLTIARGTAIICEFVVLPARGTLLTNILTDNLVL